MGDLAIGFAIEILDRNRQRIVFKVRKLFKLLNLFISSYFYCTILIENIDFKEMEALLLSLFYKNLTRARTLVKG